MQVSQQWRRHCYATNHSAIFNLDAANGGAALTAGQLYTQFNVTEESMGADDLGGVDTTANVGDFQLFRYEGGATIIQSRQQHPSFTAGETFSVQESMKNQEALTLQKQLL